MKNKDAQDLVSRFKTGEWSENERAMFTYWLHHLNQDGVSGLSDQELLASSDEIWSKMSPIKTTVKRSKLWQVIVAAAAALVFCLAFAFYFFQEPYSTPTIRYAKNNIIPGGNKAFLTLANGKRIILTNAKNGVLVNQSGFKIIKAADGQLVYSISGSTNNKVKNYNIIETPAGGQYQVALPDGTKVWLNAASSLKFPTKFATAERKVELSGEAYFEVKKEKKHPFTVKTASQEITVLGTHFNVNSYKNEPNVKTTLLEGSVRVGLNTQSSASMQNNAVILKPSQQSIFQNNKLIVLSVDIQEAIAWKNGEFMFNNESLESIMRKISRWYDVDIAYHNVRRTKSFSGKIGRFENVSEVLTMLELTGEVHFKIEGRRISVFN